MMKKKFGGLLVCAFFLAVASAWRPVPAAASDPGGGHVAYVSDEAGLENLFLLDLSSGETTRLTGFGDPGAIGAVSAPGSGDRFFFTRPSPDHGRPLSALWQVCRDGGGLAAREDITPDPAVDYRHAAVSPDGRWFAYTANTPEAPGTYSLYTISASGGPPRRLLLPGDVPAGVGYEASFPVFLDNATILYRLRVGLRYDYYLAGRDGGGAPRNLTGHTGAAPHFPRLGRPALNADRTRVIYGRQPGNNGHYGDWEIHETDIHDGATRLVSNLLYHGGLAPADQPDPSPGYPGEGRMLILGTWLEPLPADLYLSPFSFVRAGNPPYQQRLHTGASVLMAACFTLPPPPSRFAWLGADGSAYLADTAAPAATVKALGAGGTRLALSPSGTCLAQARPDGLRLFRADGARPGVVDGAVGADFPAFSPDGRWLAYVRDNFEDGLVTGRDIYLHPADLSAPAARLTWTPGLDKEDLDFAPDGRALVFTGIADGARRVYLLPVTAGRPPVASGAARALTPEGGDDFHPAFSPDSSRVYYVSRRDHRNELRVVRRDGTGRRALLFTSRPDEPRHPRSAPDGTGRLAFVAAGPGGTPARAWVTEPDGDLLTAYPIEDPAVFTSGRFAWRPLPRGTVHASRRLVHDRFDPELTLVYHLSLRVDADTPPPAVILSETLPPGWELAGVKFGGVPRDPPLTSNGALGGELQWLIETGSALFPGELEIELRVDVSVDAPAPGAARRLRGRVSASGDYLSPTCGDHSLSVAGPGPGDFPVIPLDRDGDWKIDDIELLLAIDLWARSARVDGWPSDPDRWSQWLLQVIDFWVAGGYYYHAADSLAADAPRWRPVP